MHEGMQPDYSDMDPTLRGFTPNVVLFGRYKLQKVLGRGGMGIVWKAEDQQLSREVAIKFLPELVVSDKAALDDLKRETLRSLELTHHNIVRIYDLVTDEKTAGISMEFIDGDTLAGLRLEKKNRFFEVDEISHWVRQLCDALSYAHGKAKVVHRDLKPANIMMTSKGEVKIADFGIARTISDSVSRVSMTHATSGTLVYMSPQQLDGEMPAVTDDIYALGATLYDLLSSKPPFFSGQIEKQVYDKTPVSMTQRRAELGLTGAPIPPAWEKAIAACLEKDPAKRPPSAGHLAEMLGHSDLDKTIPDLTPKALIDARNSGTIEKTRVDISDTETPAPSTSLAIKAGVAVLASFLVLAVTLTIIVGAFFSGDSTTGSTANDEIMTAAESRQMWMESNKQHYPANRTKKEQIGGDGFGPFGDIINAGANSPVPCMAVINDPDGYTNVRKEPSTKAEITERVLDGQSFLVLSVNNKWCHIITPTGKYGFMHASRVKSLRAARWMRIPLSAFPLEDYVEINEALTKRGISARKLTQASLNGDIAALRQYFIASRYTDCEGHERSLVMMAVTVGDDKLAQAFSIMSKEELEIAMQYFHYGLGFDWAPTSDKEGDAFFRTYFPKTLKEYTNSRS